MAQSGEQTSALAEKMKFKKANMRKCHDCGKPTHNYRCKAC